MIPSMKSFCVLDRMVLRQIREILAQIIMHLVNNRVGRVWLNFGPNHYVPYTEWFHVKYEKFQPKSLLIFPIINLRQISAQIIIDLHHNKVERVLGNLGSNYYAQITEWFRASFRKFGLKLLLVFSIINSRQIWAQIIMSLVHNKLAANIRNFSANYYAQKTEWFHVSLEKSWSKLLWTLHRINSRQFREISAQTVLCFTQNSLGASWGNLGPSYSPIWIEWSCAKVGGNDDK